MKELEQLVTETLGKMERKRRELRRTDKIFFTLIFILWVLYFSLYGIHPLLDSALMILAFAGLPVFIFVRVKNGKSFLREYKDSLVKPIVESKFKGFKYLAEESIPSSDFDNSQLFESYNRYSGDDYIDGTHEGVPIYFSEIHVAYVRSSSGSSSSSSRNPIFDGLFLVAQIPKDLESSLFIKPKVDISKVPKFLRTFLPERMINPPNSFSLGYEQFDSMFTICCKDPEVGKSFFDKGKADLFLMMSQQIHDHLEGLPKGALSFASSSGAPLFMSVIGNRLCLGASGIRLFEPKYKKNTFEDASQLSASLRIVSQILDFSVSLVGGGEE